MIRLLEKSDKEASESSQEIRDAKTDEEREKLLDKRATALSRRTQIAEELDREKQAEATRKQLQEKQDGDQEAEPSAPQTES